MRFPVGSTAIYREEVWAVVAVRAGTRMMRSLSGDRVIYEPADRLRPAP
ncbi:hypothetical protein NY588_09635 [Curtobacterium flaccumfaciens pv. beticola]|nr:hypothetical protein [Curtobacterium flaccumfaciens pv. basellae]